MFIGDFFIYIYIFFGRTPFCSVLRVLGGVFPARVKKKGVGGQARRVRWAMMVPCWPRSRFCVFEEPFPGTEALQLEFLDRSVQELSP